MTWRSDGRSVLAANPRVPLPTCGEGQGGEGALSFHQTPSMTWRSDGRSRLDSQPQGSPPHLWGGSGRGGSSELPPDAFDDLAKTWTGAHGRPTHGVPSPR